MDNTLKVMGLGGSLRPNSYTYLALEHAMKLLQEKGCKTHVFDVRASSLPFCDGGEACSHFPAVIDLRQQVSKAHAVVLATPEYHGSISGVLKNALDLLASEHLEGKMAGVISVLGGPPNSNALNELSRILRACHAWVMPQHIAISRPETVFVDGQVRDLALRQRFEVFADNLVRVTGQFWGIKQNKQIQERRNETFKNCLRRYGRASQRLGC